MFAINTSCESWLQVEPTDRIMEDKLYSTADGYAVALNGVYVGLINGSLYDGSLMYTSTDVMAQYYECSEIEHSYNDIATMKEAALKSFATGVWNASYPLLNNINTLLEHCERGLANKILTINMYNIIKGEALALRALLHFELYRIHGPIKKEKPSILTFPYANSSEITLRPLLEAAEIITNIYSDLEKAEELLGKSDPIIERGPLAFDVLDESNNLRYRSFRLNYYAVQALIARIALYVGDDTKAITYAKNVIQATQQDNKYFPFASREEVTALNDEDLVFSSEILFAIYNSQRTDNVYKKIFGQTQATTNVLRMSEEGIAALYKDEGDYRKAMMKQKMSPDAENLIYFVKYDKPGLELGEKSVNPRNHQVYLSVIRISEMYLIIAEANRNTNRKEAFEYINMVREKRNVANIADVDNVNILDAIRLEYAKEFIGEGQLFWFYKRNHYDAIPNLSKPEELQEILFEYIFEIPKSEQIERNEI